MNIKEGHTHLSPHNRHLSLEHGFVKAFVPLRKTTTASVSNMFLCWGGHGHSHPHRGVEQSAGVYLKQLVEVLAQVLHEVHVGQAGQHQISGLLGEGHFGLGEPGPVEGI